MVMLLVQGPHFENHFPYINDYMEFSISAVEAGVVGVFEEEWGFQDGRV